MIKVRNTITDLWKLLYKPRQALSLGGCSSITIDHYRVTNIYRLRQRTSKHSNKPTKLQYRNRKTAPGLASQTATYKISMTRLFMIITGFAALASCRATARRDDSDKDMAQLEFKGDGYNWDGYLKGSWLSECSGYPSNVLDFRS